MQMTVDGFVAGPNGELDWMVFDWDEKTQNYVWNLHEPVDLIIMGRKMSKGFLEYWNKAVEVEGPEQRFAKKMVETPKIVFSNSLETIDDENTELRRGENLSEEVAKLKSAEGGDIIVYGGAEFVGSLVRDDLIDEYNLFINPVAIGDGLRIFNRLEENLKLKLERAETFSSGEIGLVYVPIRD